MGHHVPFDKGTENIPILERREESHVWERLVRAPGGGGEGGKELKCTVPTHEKEIHCDWIPKSPLIRAKQRTQSTPLISKSISLWTETEVDDKTKLGPVRVEGRGGLITMR